MLGKRILTPLCGEFGGGGWWVVGGLGGFGFCFGGVGVLGWGGGGRWGFFEKVFFFVGFGWLWGFCVWFWGGVCVWGGVGGVWGGHSEKDNRSGWPCTGYVDFEKHEKRTESRLSIAIFRRKAERKHSWRGEALFPKLTGGGGRYPDKEGD